jgi:hypothetical protein
MPSEYTPRLSVAIDEEDMLALRRHLPTGFQKVIFNLIVKDLIRLFNKYGANQVVAAFCNQDISLDKMCRLELETKHGNDT